MNQLRLLLQKDGISLNEQQESQFDSYYRLLIEWNEKFNLTAITDKREVVLKHFYDSLSLSFVVGLESSQNLIDVGSGAGFPSLPLKIMFPHLQVTIVDSLRKRIRFLEHVKTELDLKHVTCVHGRAEDVGRDNAHRDRYDIVTARAVARLNVLNEICLPFAKKDGMFVAMKGNDPQDEIKQASKSFQTMRSKLKEVHRFVLPGEEEAVRHLVVVQKLAHTPKSYPRKAGTPFKKPLQ